MKNTTTEAKLERMVRATMTEKSIGYSAALRAVCRQQPQLLQENLPTRTDNRDSGVLGDLVSVKMRESGMSYRAALSAVCREFPSLWAAQ